MKTLRFSNTLLGSGRPYDLLRLFGERVVIEERTYEEVKRNPFNGNSGHESLNGLTSSGLLHLERLSDKGYELFLELTGATPPDDLGDGEAATIAHCMVTGGIPLLDEKKGSRIVRDRGIVSMSTVDLLRSHQIITAMGQEELAGIIYCALTKARMRVPPEHKRWAIDVLGSERAASCTSLGLSFLNREAQMAERKRPVLNHP